MPKSKYKQFREKVSDLIAQRWSYDGLKREEISPNEVEKFFNISNKITTLSYSFVKEVFAYGGNLKVVENIVKNIPTYKKIILNSLETTRAKNLIKFDDAFDELNEDQKVKFIYDKFCTLEDKKFEKLFMHLLDNARLCYVSTTDKGYALYTAQDWEKFCDNFEQKFDIETLEKATTNALDIKTYDEYTIEECDTYPHTEQIEELKK